MDKLYRALCAPGSLKTVTGIATTSSALEDSTAIYCSAGGDSYESRSSTTTTHKDEEAAVAHPQPAKQRVLDRWLDKVVSAAGSTPSFTIILIALLVWVFLGIPYGKSENWQILISDVQAVFCYIYDSLLMRQTFNIYQDHMRVAATLQSRNITLNRMVNKLVNDENYTETRKIALAELSRPIHDEHTLKVSWVGKTCNFTSGVLGHWFASVVFWLGVVAWLGCGPYMSWSDEWELYMNSATSAAMLFIFGFVANMGERFAQYTNETLQHLHTLDAELETKLRVLSNDRTPNEVVTIAPQKVGKLQRAVFYYADLVGTLTGLAILTGVIVLWVCIGPALRFNSNWWLIIGTYAGLIGMHDAVVLRNIHHQLAKYEDSAYQTVHRQDQALFSSVHPELAWTSTEPIPSSSQRISIWLSNVCAHTWSVVVVALTVVVLITIATIMKWSVTGQLICNVPPSILETSLMMILITGHNVSDGHQKEQLEEIRVRRLRLTRWVDAMGKAVRAVDTTAVLTEKA